MVFSRKLVSNNPNSILIPLFHHFLVKYFFYLLSYRPVRASSQVHQILESLFQCFCWSSSYFSRWNPMQISPFLLIHQHVGGHKFDWKSPSIHIYPSFFHHFPIFPPFFHHFFRLPPVPPERSQARLGRRRGPDRQDLGRRRAPRSLGLRGAGHQPGGALISLNVEFIQLMCGIWVEF